MSNNIHLPMMGSYNRDDVVFLLKDLSNFKLEEDTRSREKLNQSGIHYSETLPVEYAPAKSYMNLFWQSLHQYKEKVALNIGVVAEQIFARKEEKTVLISLARAGTPIGILIKRYLKEAYQINLPHYCVSIIRGKGVDEQALRYVIQHHPEGKLQFVDGWTGKGAISLELQNSCQKFSLQQGTVLDDTLAVVADPGYCSDLYGTREDFLIPSACLNSTVSGLVSRTVLTDTHIGPGDFHGAKYYRELSNSDVSNDFVDLITDQFSSVRSEASQLAKQRMEEKTSATFQGMKEVKQIQAEFAIDSLNRIKPGVGETTRVLLRRVPWKILLKDPDSPYVKHIKLLAKEKGVEIVHYPSMSYTSCGLIKKVGVEKV